MRIGVDCHVLSGKYQGSRTYLLNLYKAVLELDRENEYVFFGHWGDSRPFGRDARYVEFPSTSRWKRLTYQTSRLITENSIDLYHTNYISPLLLPCRSLVTVHDILYETHPAYFTVRDIMANRLLVRSAVNRAVQVHTVSTYSKEMLMEQYGLSDEKVTIIPNGVDLITFAPENGQGSAGLIEEKFGVKDYLLSVGRLEPRKNHVGLLQAYARLRQINASVGPLVIVGQRDFSCDAFFRMVHELGLQDHVTILENVDDNLLPDIIRGARLFVYPSFAEGFGIPPLEAMACGIPVVSSNRTSIPEVVGNAGILVDPEDTAMLCEAMHTVLTDPDLAACYASAGRRQAEIWTWENAATKYVENISLLAQPSLSATAATAGKGGLKIAIDTHFITSGTATGNLTYTAELLQAMIALDSPHEFILYAIEDHPFYRQFSGNPRVRVRHVLSPQGPIRNFYSLPRALAQDRPDIAHLLFICPSLVKVPVILTVHDLFYVHRKDIGFYNRLIGKLTAWSIPRAAKVITISEYSRQDIIESCRVAPGHVIATPLGIDSRFKPMPDMSGVREKTGITGPYILYVGRTEDARKNLATLIDAYAILRKEGGVTEQLVIAGRHGQGTELLFARVAEHGLAGSVLFPGIVPDEDLVALMSGAAMFVYVSSFEGFGLPVLEAMACGVPVITSSGTSLAEVAGDAALMVTPGDVGELAAAMLRLRSDRQLQDNLRRKGFGQVARFNWELTARATLDVYEDVVGRSGQLP